MSPIRRVPVFANPKLSLFCQSGRVPNSPIWRGPLFANPEGSQFYQSGRVTNSPIRNDPNFAKPEGSQFCQSGGVLFCQDLIRQKESEIVKNRLLGDRLGTSDCTGNLPFIKDQTKTKQV